MSPHIWLQDIGSVFVCCLFILGLLAQYRGCEHSRMAILAILIYLGLLIPLRIMTSHAVITPDQARTTTGVIAAPILVIVIQETVLAQIQLNAKRRLDRLAQQLKELPPP